MRHGRFLDLLAYHPVCNLKENGLVATMRKVKTKIQTKYSVFLVKSREYQQVKFLQRIFCSWFVITLRAFFIRVSKNNVITTNQSELRTTKSSANENSVKKNKLLKGRENAGDQVLVLQLIGWDGGASFLNQLKSEFKQNQSNPGSLSTLNWKLLRLKKLF